MKFANVQLVLQREMRDQLRDRRTLFTIGVIPLLLYPLMGMAMLQMAQFMRKTETEVVVVGADRLGDDCELITDGVINPDFRSDKDSDLTNVTLFDSGSKWESFLQATTHSELTEEEKQEAIRRLLKSEQVDLAVWVLPAIENTENTSSDAPDNRRSSNQIVVFSDSSSDKSKLAASRFKAILFAWEKKMFAEHLASQNILVNSEEFANIQTADVGDKSRTRASFWAKVLPFVIMIWALTGAFYPAIDLCAGEKERGTLETLLCSPAKRSEIVFGKILATMSFSMATSVLNLASMAFTGMFVVKSLGDAAQSPIGAIGPPPLHAVFWLVIALVPISALFSALAVAVAAFARSSKEGQYYLMPLIMIAMPLVMLPMLPASTLNLGTSLIPLTGLMLMLRALIEGQYAEAIAFGGPVCMVTVACCWFAARWAIGQFNNESVLFRASDRVGFGSLVRYVIGERQERPLLGHALLCGMLILILKFFIGLSATPEMNWPSFTKTTIIILVATVAMPAILMALMVTSKPRLTLGLSKLNLRSIPIAIFLGLALHPAFTILSRTVLEVFPPSADLSALNGALGQLMASAPNLFFVLLVMAIAPAVFEELAFRGFILSGLKSIRNHWWAILISSLFFGAAHAVLQQSIVTFFIGIVLAMVCIRCNSILPCIAYHATHNSLSIICSGVYPGGMPGWLPGLVQANGAGGYDYMILPSILLSSAGFLTLIWLWYGGLERPKPKWTRFKSIFRFRKRAAASS